MFHQTGLKIDEEPHVTCFAVCNLHAIIPRPDEISGLTVLYKGTTSGPSCFGRRHQSKRI
jgi:hypothetical protein